MQGVHGDYGRKQKCHLLTPNASGEHRGNNYDPGVERDGDEPGEYEERGWISFIGGPERLKAGIHTKHVADQVVNYLDHELYVVGQRPVVKDMRIEIEATMSPIPEFPGDGKGICFFIKFRQVPVDMPNA